MKFVIRQARRRDADAMARLWIAMMEEHRGFERRVRLSEDAHEAYAEYVRYHCGRRDSVMFVVEARGQTDRSDREIVGFSLAYRARNLPMFLPEQYGFISDVTVAAPFRGRGLGRRLVERTREEFEEMGLPHAQLQVYRANDGGRRFWRRMDFEPYIEGMWLDL